MIKVKRQGLDMRRGGGLMGKYNFIKEDVFTRKGQERHHSHRVRSEEE